MKDLQKDFKQEKVLSLPEAADKMGIARSSFNRWLNNHPEIKEAYCYKDNYKGGRRKTVIKISAFPVIANMKDGFRGNQNEKSTVSVHLQKGKKNFAESAIATAEKNQAIVSELGVLINGIIENHPAFKELQQANAERDGDILKHPLTDGQRKMLNERVRRMVYETEDDFPIAWKRIHEVTGKRSIEDYVFEDYSMAIRYLKQYYKLHSIKW